MLRPLGVNRAGVGHLNGLYGSLGPTQYFHLAFVSEDKNWRRAYDGPAVGISVVVVDATVAAAGS